jgi:hypothetical protein
MLARSSLRSAAASAFPHLNPLLRGPASQPAPRRYFVAAAPPLPCAALRPTSVGNPLVRRVIKLVPVEVGCLLESLQQLAGSAAVAEPAFAQEFA